MAVINELDDVSNSSSLKLILLPLFLDLSWMTRSIRGLSSTSLESMLFLRACLRGVSPGSRRAWVNKLLRFSRAELAVEEFAHLGGGSKSESRSEGSGGGGSWRSCVREADDVFGTWASSARSLAAGVSSVAA